jgi:exopolysaccharide production protein ExoZ
MSSPHSPPSRGEFVSIQYLRGLAASMVVLYHIFGFEGFGLPTWQMGGAGVDIFFVISGFIMWTTSQNLGPRNFLGRRLVRLVPLYWLFTLLMVAGAAFLGGRSVDKHGIGFSSTLLSLFFIPFHINFDPTQAIMPVLPQGWTLTYEMIFYLSFALALLLPARRTRAVFLTVWFGMLCTLGFLESPGEPILRAITNPIMIEFLMGIGVAAIAHRLPSHLRAAIAVFIGAFLLLSASGHQWFNHPARSIVIGVPAAMLVLAAVALETTLRRWPLPLLRAIGDASYALYLCHSFVLKGWAMMLGHLPFPAALLRAPGIPVFPIFLAGGLTTCIISAIAIHYLLEKPATLWLNTALGLRRRVESPSRTTSELPVLISSAATGESVSVLGAD